MAAHQTHSRLSDGEVETTPGSILLEKLVGRQSILTGFLMVALQDEPVPGRFSLASREEGPNALMRMVPMQQPQIPVIYTVDRSEATPQLGKSTLNQLLSEAGAKQAPSKNERSVAGSGKCTFSRMLMDAISTRGLARH
jgi:hypothetical protein